MSAKPRLLRNCWTCARAVLRSCSECTWTTGCRILKKELVDCDRDIMLLDCDRDVMLPALPAVRGVLDRMVRGVLDRLEKPLDGIRLEDDAAPRLDVVLLVRRLDVELLVGVGIPVVNDFDISTSATAATGFGSSMCSALRPASLGRDGGAPAPRLKALAWGSLSPRLKVALASALSLDSF
mmetsp:Transcript_42353/g.112066  ORF Transcript_42353/g.112066 Transcript_42353/m.112066 type:complete len:181 (+) Transcript_42353:571-1113(+)